MVAHGTGDALLPQTTCPSKSLDMGCVVLDVLKTGSLREVEKYCCGIKVGTGFTSWPDSGVRRCGKLKRNPHDLHSELIKELNLYTTKICPSPSEVLFWPKIAVERWNYVNRPKGAEVLAVLSWNTNGRLSLRGCRENLLRRWVRKGFVDVALIQEHFKDDTSPLFNLFGSEWRNFSSGAVGNDCGRKSGGCAISVQP